MDKDFAAFLVPQHASGVDLAKIENRAGKNLKLKKIASNILVHADRNDPVITKISIGQFSPSAIVEAKRRLAQANKQAIYIFDHLNKGSYDSQFATLMGAHHQRAIQFADTERRFGQDSHLRSLACAIISDQAPEHAYMMRLMH